MTSDEDRRRAWRRVIPHPRLPLMRLLTEAVWTLVAGLAFMYMLAAPLHLRMGARRLKSKEGLGRDDL